MTTVGLLPDEVVAMQALLFYTGSIIQRRCYRENGTRSQLHASFEVIRLRNSAQEMVEDFEQVWLLEPDLASRFAASEKPMAACYSLWKTT